MIYVLDFYTSQTLTAETNQSEYKPEFNLKFYFPTPVEIWPEFKTSKYINDIHWTFKLFTINFILFGFSIWDFMSDVLLFNKYATWSNETVIFYGENTSYNFGCVNRIGDFVKVKNHNNLYGYGSRYGYRYYPYDAYQ